MLPNRLFILVLGLFSINLTSGIQARAQTNINFTEFPVQAQVKEKYVNRGVLFSSLQGTPTIVQDTLITGKIGLCALARRTMGTGILAVQVNSCEDVYVGFVYPNKKMVHNFAKNINIRVLAVGGVTAYWRDQEGEIKDVEASLSANNELGVSIPDETEGVFLTSTDPDCGFCNFTVTSVSFVLSKSTDLICSQPVTDAGFSWRRLANEDYPHAMYDRLDEFRQPKQPLKIRFQYLKANKETYYDEYAIIVKLPAGDRDMAQEIFADMRRKLDTVGLGQPATKFKDIGSFTYFEPDKIASRPGKLPIVGDIFKVDIRPGFHLTGLDNGDVMMTELQESPGHSRFRYSTLTNDLRGGSGSHPNNGSREYGYRTTLDGWTKFYVRGIDQFRERLATVQGREGQDEFWRSFLEGIGNRVKFNNGEVIYPATKTVDETLTTPPRCHVPPKSGYGI